MSVWYRLYGSLPFLKACAANFGDVGSEPGWSSVPWQLAQTRVYIASPRFRLLASHLAIRPAWSICFSYSGITSAVTAGRSSLARAAPPSATSIRYFVRSRNCWRSDRISTSPSGISDCVSTLRFSMSAFGMASRLPLSAKSVSVSASAVSAATSPVTIRPSTVTTVTVS